LRSERKGERRKRQRGRGRERKVERRNKERGGGRGREEVRERWREMEIRKHHLQEAAGVNKA
jgi:hypothetical protein